MEIKWILFLISYFFSRYITILCYHLILVRTAFITCYISYSSTIKWISSLHNSRKSWYRIRFSCWNHTFLFDHLVCSSETKRKQVRTFLYTILVFEFYYHKKNVHSQCVYFTVFSLDTINFITTTYFKYLVLRSMVVLSN